MRYAISIMIAGLLLSSISSIAYSTHRDNVQDRRWCELLTTLDQPLPPNIPEDQRKRSQKILNEISQLNKELGCGR